MEFELKLEIPPDCLALVKADVLEHKATEQHLHARYFDTADRALTLHKLTLRVRKEGTRWVQTAKGETNNFLERLEHNVDIAAPTAGGMPQANLLRHFGTPVGIKLLAALKLSVSDVLPELVPLFDTDVVRLKHNVLFAGSDIEIALDQGNVIVGANSIPLCELEIELKKGKFEDAIQLASILCAKHKLWLSTRSKSMKGQLLLCNQLHEPATSALTPEYKRSATGEQIVKAVLQSCLWQILANATELAGGSIEADHVHQLRVGIRRLRTAMRELGKLVEGIDPAWEPPLIGVFRALGEYRDGDHLAFFIQPQLNAAGGPKINIKHLNPLMAKSADFNGHAASESISNVIRSHAFQHVLLSIIAYIHRADFEHTINTQAAIKNKAAKKILREHLQKLHVQIIKSENNFLSLKETSQHRVRKRLKRLRYLTEFLAPLYSSHKTNAFINKMKPVQDALGFYNDELVALQCYKRLAVIDKRAFFGVGWLSARRKPNAIICSQALEGFAKIQPFWK